MTEYLETDEQNDVLTSLREVSHQLDRIKLDAGNWKWAVIALSSAVNGAMTCNLTGTMQIGALEKNKVEKTVSALQSKSTQNLPIQHLAKPLELLNRIQNKDRFEQAGPPIEITSAQENSVATILFLRNQFMHFSPSSWLIEVNGLPNTFVHIISLIDIIRNDGWSFRHLGAANAKELDGLIQKIANQLLEMTIP